MTSPRNTLNHSSIGKDKSALRERMRTTLGQISPVARTEASQKARALLEKQLIWREAKSILFYAPLQEELDVWPMLVDAIAAGKTVLLPRFHLEHNHYVACLIHDASRDVRMGKFGVREPLDTCEKISLNRLDLILVPGIAFDLAGGRIGRGKGFYDRLLAALQGPTCGVAFDEQIVSHIPVEPHDIRLNCILTPTRWQSEAGRTVLK